MLQQNRIQYNRFTPGKNKKEEGFKNRTSKARGNLMISLVHENPMDFEGFRGHDFKVLAENFDRNPNLVLGVVSPTCTHSGRLLDIISSVFGVSDT